MRVGTGIFVVGPELRRKRDSGTHTVGDDGPGPFDLLAARAMIEGEIAALAARNARKADIAALREAIARMRAHADDAVERDAADRGFHVRIAEMTRNGALPLAVAHLWDLRFCDIFTRIEAHFHTPALRAKTLADHEAIVAALAARDADARARSDASALAARRARIPASLGRNRRQGRQSRSCERARPAQIDRRGSRR